MKNLKFPTDRRIESTENNGYAEGARDESLWAEDLVDTEVPETVILPDKMNETGEKDREIYDEGGYENITP